LFIHEDLKPKNWASLVLLVDDEASVRKLLSIYLEDAGYKVLSAAAVEKMAMPSQFHDVEPYDVGPLEYSALFCLQELP
jgi:DNA-binding NtrC family response regulator